MKKQKTLFLQTTTGTINKVQDIKGTPGTSRVTKTFDNIWDFLDIPKLELPAKSG